MQFNDHFHKHDEGLAMGAPTSDILVETFIQHFEHSKLIKILNKHQIIDYHRYVDDILILYNKNNTNINNTLHECNTIHPDIIFTMETEIHNTLNYLDLTITNKYNKVTFSIYRKPTSTDLIIHNDSCHPYEHKKSATTYLINRMITYPITQENKNHELNTINEILTNHHYQRITNVNQHNKSQRKQHTTAKIKKIKMGHLHILRPRNNNNN
jgi:hypothetical protein